MEPAGATRREGSAGSTVRRAMVQVNEWERVNQCDMDQAAQLCGNGSARINYGVRLVRREGLSLVRRPRVS
jgi:hypothetical protein